MNATATTLIRPTPVANYSFLADLVEELTNRLQAGEPADIESYVALYPERAEELRRLMPAMAVLADLGRSATRGPSAVTSAPDESVEALGTLGDFRIIRELGRGGMGVVYEAEQISLGRRVALKMLPFAANLDPKQLQRFKNESHNAASLDHPNIVRVHAVGCERGMHFYAMQLIEGMSLAELLDELRSGPRPAAVPISPDQPTLDSASVPLESGDNGTAVKRNPLADTGPFAALTTEHAKNPRAYFRHVAELGIQAAEALDYAHQMGIVHRDMKPANLMLDGRGNLWITDFGLARNAADAGITMTGDLLGTLRYMSPEQALAQRVTLDHRSDVYSLGVTLYELLTLAPAFDGKDRAEVLKQIAFDEPRKPRSINKRIPAELETIVLKAMEKRPEDRYQTAKELAEDLRRWSEEKPIKARPPGVVQKAGKWMRRHRALMASSILGISIAAIALGASTVWAWRKNDQTELAMQNEATQKIAAQQNEHYALQEATRARASHNIAMDLLDRFQLHFPEQDWAWTLDGPQRRRRAEEIKSGFLAAIRINEANPESQYETAVAYRAYGKFCSHFGDLSEAIRAYEKSVSLLRERLSTSPDSEQCEFELWKSIHGLAFCLLLKQVPEQTPVAESLALRKKSKTLLDEAREGLRALADKDVSNAAIQKELVYLQLSFGSFYIATVGLTQALTEFEEAGRICDNALARLPDDPDLKVARSGVWSSLARVHASLGHHREVVHALQRSSSASDYAIHYIFANPMHGRLLVKLALKLEATARWLEAQGDAESADLVYREHVTTFRRAFHMDEHLLHWLASALYSHGEFLYRQGRYDDGEARLRECTLCFERALSQSAENSKMLNYCIYRFKIGTCYWLASKKRAAAIEFEIATNGMEELAHHTWKFGAAQNAAYFRVMCPDPSFRDAARALEYAREYARKAEEIAPGRDLVMLNRLGMAQYRAGDWKEAVESLLLAPKFAACDDLNHYYLAMCYWQLGEFEKAVKSYESASRFVMNIDWILIRREAAELLGILEETRKLSLSAPRGPAGGCLK